MALHATKVLKTVAIQREEDEPSTADCFVGAMILSQTCQWAWWLACNHLRWLRLSDQLMEAVSRETKERDFSINNRFNALLIQKYKLPKTPKPHTIAGEHYKCPPGPGWEMMGLRVPACIGLSLCVCDPGGVTCRTVVVETLEENRICVVPRGHNL